MGRFWANSHARHSGAKAGERVVVVSSPTLGVIVGLDPTIHYLNFVAPTNEKCHPGATAGIHSRPVTISFQQTFLPFTHSMDNTKQHYQAIGKAHPLHDCVDDLITNPGQTNMYLVP